MNLVEIFDAVAKEVGVHVGELLQRADNRHADKVVEGDIDIQLALFQHLLCLLAQSLDAACVGAEVVGKLCGVLQTCIHALGNHLADIAELADLKVITALKDILAFGCGCG